MKRTGSSKTSKRAAVGDMGRTIVRQPREGCKRVRAHDEVHASAREVELLAPETGVIARLRCSPCNCASSRATARAERFIGAGTAYTHERSTLNCVVAYEQRIT